MLFSTQTSTANCKTINNDISIIVSVDSFTLSTTGLYVNYKICLPGSGEIQLMAGQKFIPAEDPRFAALATPIKGFDSVFKMLAPSLVEEAL